jgi:hypothetical protein
VREVVRLTPLQQDVLKFFALVLMVFDHANRALGLHEPLFALLWGYNLASRPVRQALAMRKGAPNPVLAGGVLLALWWAYGATDGSYGTAGVLVLLASYGLCVSLPGYVTAVWPLLVLMLNANLGGLMMLTGLLLPALLILGT